VVNDIGDCLWEGDGVGESICIRVACFCATPPPLCYTMSNKLYTYVHKHTHTHTHTHTQANHIYTTYVEVGTRNQVLPTCCINTLTCRGRARNGVKCVCLALRSTYMKRHGKISKRNLSTRQKCRTTYSTRQRRCACVRVRVCVCVYVYAYLSVCVCMRASICECALIHGV
jgi:hypothetical protein